MSCSLDKYWAKEYGIRFWNGCGPPILITTKMWRCTTVNWFIFEIENDEFYSKIIRAGDGYYIDIKTKPNPNAF